MAITDLWYKNAVIYCLDVEKFQDANGDGVGDFEGLGRRLDYLHGLGVTCVWLQPFYPSPNRDNGYDVADYYGIHAKHGSLGDFVAFMQHARFRMRIIRDWRDTSLVTLHNFTSARHNLRVNVESPRDALLVDVFDGSRSRAQSDGAHRLHLDGYGWRWLRVGSGDNALERSDLDLTNPMR